MVDALAKNSNVRSWFLDAIAKSAAGRWALDSHVAIVRDRHRTRELMRLGGELANLAEHGDGSADDLLSRHRSDLIKLEGTSHGDHSDLGDVALAELESIESGVKAEGAPLGIRWWDVEVGGTVPGEVCVIAARPGMGKTALVVQGVDAASRAGYATFVISAEMPKRLLSWRFLARMSGVSLTAFRSRKFDRVQWQAVYDASTELKARKIRVVDETRSLETLWAQVHRWAHENKGRKLALYCDYLTKLPIRPRKGQTMDEAIGEVSWAFAEFAKRYDMSVILAAQLSREVEKSDRKPIMSDLRSSGNIEQDASQIVFPWRPDMFNNPTRAELILCKNRNGEAGITKEITFEPQTGRFTEE